MTNEQQPQVPPYVNHTQGHEAFKPELKRYDQEPEPIPAIIVQQMQEPVRQSRDRAQYVRNQKGHSLVLHLLFGGFLLWIPTIYFAISPNHYFHA